MNFVDFTDCDYSDRNGTYSGTGGCINGIVYKDNNWLIKFPYHKSFVKDLNCYRYATHYLSEYIGSHIYSMLGYNTQETVLGVYDKSICVGCKDFLEDRGTLFEVCNILNSRRFTSNDVSGFVSSSKSIIGLVDLNHLLFYLDHSYYLDSDVVRQRFWDMVVVDVLIDNTDRNNGNWALIKNDNKFKLAPIYDNGNSFSVRKGDPSYFDNVRALHGDELVKSLSNNLTIYMLDNKVLRACDMLAFDNDYLKRSVVKNYKNYMDVRDEIFDFIDNIDNEYKGHFVISDDIKSFYKKSLDIRAEHTIEPYYKKYSKELSLSNFCSDIENSTNKGNTLYKSDDLAFDK